MVINRFRKTVNLLTQLLPSQDHLQLQSYELDPNQRQVRVFVESVQTTIRCPGYCQLNRSKGIVNLTRFRSGY